MFKNNQSKSNNFMRKVLQEIISQKNSPQTQNPKDLHQLTNNQAVKYLQNKIQRYQAEINILSQQLSKEINLKEHVAYLLNKEKQKSAKLYDIIQNQAEKLFIKMENNSRATSSRGKSRQSHDEKVRLKSREKQSCRLQSSQNVNKKDEKIQKLNEKIKLLEERSEKQKNLHSQMQILKKEHLKIKKLNSQLLQRTMSMSKKITQQDKQLRIKQEDLLFSEEHLRRAKIECQEIQNQQIQERNQFSIIVQQMKKLLHRQNLEIHDLQIRSMSVSRSHKKSSLEITQELPKYRQHELSDILEQPSVFCSYFEQDSIKHDAFNKNLIKQSLKNIVNI